MYSNSISGIQANIDLLNNAAKKIANSREADLPRDFTDMIIAERGFRANLVALRTSLRLSSHLIDLLA